MTERCFVDSNVLLYSTSNNPSEVGKSQRATELLQRSDLALSVQVLQEFYSQATRPQRPGALSHREAMSFIETLLRFPVLEVTLELMLASANARALFRISYWDAAILEAARSMRCSTVFSEDLSDAQDYGGIRVVNPFK